MPDRKQKHTAVIEPIEHTAFDHYRPDRIPDGVGEGANEEEGDGCDDAWMLGYPVAQSVCLHRGLVGRPYSCFWWGSTTTIIPFQPL
jgi:hypothetical protein